MGKSSGRQKIMPYGLWRSSVEIEALMEQPCDPSYPFKFHGRLYWLEAVSAEKGRIALMQESEGASPTCITPRGFNIRTGVHEYGGRCFCIVGNSIIFNNYNDGNLYRQPLQADSQARLLTKQNEACCGYADLIAVPDKDDSGERVVVAVMELAREDGCNQNCLAAIVVSPAASGDALLAAEPVVIAQGADFYANPVISPDGQNIAWFEWNHPYMPWDRSRLVCARLANVHDQGSNRESGRFLIRDAKIVVNEPNRSVCQLGYLHDQSLIFASDSEACDYWNLFKYDKQGVRQLTDRAGEFGEAHWVFGQRRWQAVGEEVLIATVTRADGDELVRVDVGTGDCTVLHRGFSACSHLQTTAEGELLLIGKYTDRPAEMVSLSVQCGRIKTLQASRLRAANPGAEFQDYSAPELIKFPTSDNRIAWGYFYPPCNRNCAAPDNSRPPLLMLVHGGPTSKATSELVGIKQYFCSLGYALLDVNHRGSTGHGRKYRQSLLGNWGEYDADDIANAIKYVVDKQWVDPNLVFIRGSSAGGYAVLRALTRFPGRFAAGACYYGIGNLITLSKITHKFEAKYTDQLIGEMFDAEKSGNPESRFVARSPIFQMENLSSPLILFQGGQDKVVPPAVSREMAALLKAKGIQHGYTEYPGEGHGFRQVETRVDALRKETAFFAEIIMQRHAAENSHQHGPGNKTSAAKTHRGDQNAAE